MKKKSRLLMVAFTLNASFVLGQVPYFQSYYPLKKNISLEANTLFQDRSGFMWFGTDQGLFRFDGVNYEHFVSSDTVIDNDITALAEDSLGRIWLGHRDGRLSFLEKGQLHLFEPDEGSASEPVSDIIFDRSGNMWFSTLNDGLYYYVKDRLYRVDQEEGLPDTFIYDLFEDREGNIWAGTDGGIAVCTLTDRKISIRVIDSDDGLPDIIVKKIKAFQGDTISIATEDAGILNYNTRTQKLESVMNVSWPYGAISDFAIKENQIWISIPSDGLAVYDRRTRRLKLFKEYEEQDLKSINALLKDNQGNIWCGSKTAITRTLGDAVEHLESLAPCTDINILALVVDRHDRIWFSTSEGLFQRSYRHDGTAVVEQKLKHTPYSKANVISLYEDEDGFIWAGLYGAGLLRIDPVTSQIRHFDKELRNGNILSITGKNHTIWVGTLGGSSSLAKDKNGYVI
jgi:ligand-binding sensor domain-containing protein